MLPFGRATRCGVELRRDAAIWRDVATWRGVAIWRDAEWLRPEELRATE
jgi:hypothetical protein